MSIHSQPCLVCSVFGSLSQHTPPLPQCVALFQKLGGVDILLYCVYMQEYGDDAGPSNRRTAYLSYLDSVKYF